LPAISYAVLRSSAVQSFLANKIATYLSNELNTEIKVGGLNIAYFLDIVIEDVEIKDLHNKTLLNAPSIKVDISELSIKRQKIVIDKIILKNTKIALRKYKSDDFINLKFIIDYFSSQDTTKKDKWDIKCSSLELVKSQFSYKNEHKNSINQGIDFNNLNLSEVNININDFAVISDTVIAKINNISLKEQSGFVLNRLKTNIKFSSSGIEFKNLEIKTPDSDLKLDLLFSHSDFTAYSDFVNNVRIKSKIQTSKLNEKDIGYFAHALFDMDNSIVLAGEIKGKISNLKVKNFSFLYKNSTKFDGNITLSGLPDIEETFIHIAIKEFSTTQSDIESINIKNKDNEPTHLSVPENLANLGKINIKGYFTGFYNDFVSFADFQTGIGKISTDISLKNNKIKNIIEYDGKLAVRNFDIGKLIDKQDILGKVSMSTDVKGAGFDKNVAAELISVIDSVVYKNYQYTNIKINGGIKDQIVDAKLIINNKNLNLNLEGTTDFSGKVPEFNITSEIRNAKLRKLNLYNKDSLSPVLSTSLSLNCKGDNVDNIHGIINIDSTSYRINNKTYRINNFELVALNEALDKRKIKLKSDFFDMNIDGVFRVNDLVAIFEELVKEYLPSYSSNIAQEKKEINSNQNFNYKINFYETSQLTELFIPKLSIAQNTTISGQFNSENNSLTIIGNSDFIRFNQYVFNNFFVDCRTLRKKILFDVGCERLNLTDSMWVDNFNVNTSLKNDSINYNIFWDNEKLANKYSGNIEGFLTFLDKNNIKIKFLKAETTINDTLWAFSKDNFITIDTSSIVINNFEIANEFQKLNVNGKISNNASDEVDVFFKNFNISNFDIITNKKKYDFDGILNGSIKLVDLYNHPNVLSNVSIDKFGLNHEKLGNTYIESKWDNENKAAYIKAKIIYVGNIGTNQPLSVEGYFYPQNEDENFDFNIELTNFKLRVLQNYLSSFSSSLYGLASGKLEFKGSMAKPELTGKLKLMRTTIKIDYLNTVYSFADEIIIDKNYFHFDNIILNDNNDKENSGKTAIFDGKIYHNNFKDWRLDLSFKPDHFTMLHTNSTQNDLFYGKAVATGVIKIFGDVKHISMDIKAKTEKGTKLFIPLDYTEEASETNYITFSGLDTIFKIKNEENEIDFSGINMNFELDVTPDAEIQMILDEKVGDIIKAKGNGNINMVIDTRGNFNMFGDYIITEGDYLFTLQNIINKKLTIQKGGSIKWTGSPYDADINLKAIYKTKAPLYDLISKYDNTEVYKKKMPVECILGLKNKLMNPVVNFDINLPYADELAKKFLKDALYINENEVNVQEMNRQFVGLLVLNRFFPTAGSESNNTGSYADIGTTNSMEMLSNQLSNWLSQISDDFDIGVSYSAGDKISNNELEVALSTQLFNDRLSINGNIDVGGEQATETNQTSQKSSNIVGDVNIEYKWTDEGKFKIKAFNRSNETDYVNEQSPYTQGLGIFYRKEFDTFRDIFKSEKKKKRKNKKK